MDCFLQKEIDNAKFPKLTNRVYYLKHEEGGVNAVCEVMRKYSDEAYKQGEEAGQRQANIAAVRSWLFPHHKNHYILDIPHQTPYNKPIFFIKLKLQNKLT